MRAAVAAALFAAYTGLSRYLPAVETTLGAVLASGFAAALAALVQWDLAALPGARRRPGVRRLLVVLLAAGLAAAVACSLAGWVPGANVGKVLFATAAGLLLAGALERVSWVVLIAAVVTVTDVVSVYFGPTKVLIAQGPRVIGAFTVALAWPGYRPDEAYTALGVADFIFFALYLGAARRFGLRAGWTAVAMTLSFALSIGAGFWLTAVPALPLLSAAVLLVNADLLWVRLRGGGRAETPHGL
ncbi:MAG: hypothetical protein JW767_03765 [Thermoleophilia bacterium]|nr:hypothetical protein [Thermoleophilia bacterium]